MFAQAAKPHEAYNAVIESLNSSVQTGEEMFNFLKLAASRSAGDIFEPNFKIPLELTPKFSVSIFNYIYHLEAENQTVYMPDVSVSLNGEQLRPQNSSYIIGPGMLKIKYSDQVYAIMVIGR